MTAANKSCAEETTVKAGSPGLINDRETVAYLLFDPGEIEDGVLGPSAFSIKRLKKAGDLSICRPAHTSRADVDTNVIASRTKGGSMCAGVVVAAVKVLRDILFDDNNKPPKTHRAVCVVDDPKPFPGHSYLAFSEQTKGLKDFQNNQATSIRSNILLAFEAHGPPKAVDAVFS